MNTRRPAPGLLPAVAALLLSSTSASAAAGTAPAADHSGGLSRLGITLLSLAAVLAVGRLAGALSRRLGHPAVVGEMAAGILLGPVLLGGLLHWAGWGWAERFDAGGITLLGRLGLLLFLFTVGMEADWNSLRDSGRLAGAVSVAGIALPFLSGTLCAFPLHQRYGGPSLLAFTLFMGIAMSITAFPVLARIVFERKMEGTRIGKLALAGAAADDVLAWSLLGLVIPLAQNASAGSALRNSLLAMVFIGTLHLVLRPLIAKAYDRWKPRGGPGQTAFTAAVLAVLLSATATDYLGLHALFGAFLAGTAVPNVSELRAFLRARMEQIGTWFLLPCFFVAAGLKIRLQSLDSAVDWGYAGLILVLAIAGKFGGTFLVARWSGMERKDCLRLGALMNTRGLMEFVVIEIGYELGILPPPVFALLAMMALVTTAMTGVVLNLIDRSESRGDPPRSPPTGGGFGTLVPAAHSGSWAGVSPAAGKASPGLN